MATAERVLIKTPTAGWYIDPANGEKKVRKADGDKIVTRAEWEKLNKKGTKAEPKREPVILDTGKIAHGPTTTIKCVDCKVERVIQVQDRFQVKRCLEHQKEHRNKLRRERRAAKKS